MGWKKKGSPCFMASLFVLAFFADQAYAIVPTERISATEIEIRSIILDPKFKGEAMKEERRKLLRPVLTACFDFEEMAKRSLGPHWRHYPDRQKEFVRIFTDFLERSYIGHIESFNDEVITYVKENVDGKYAEVYSTVTLPESNTTITLDYKLHDQNGDWKVYDVIVMNVSMVNNYRSQFNRVISKDGFDVLVTKLKEKSGSVK